MTAYLLVIGTSIGAGTLATLLTQAVMHHLAEITAALLAVVAWLTALRGGRHARLISRPHLTLMAHGAHTAPRARHETTENPA